MSMPNERTDDGLDPVVLRGEIPDDLADAAEAALDDMLTEARDSEPDLHDRTERRAKMPLSPPRESEPGLFAGGSPLSTTPLDALDVVDDDIAELAGRMHRADDRIERAGRAGSRRSGTAAPPG